ncbi:MAG: hypothetical protein A3C30_04360 [Candidatus Levybacteria bacterium RIFCSPHIGHO2_02_FULL_40_18]|nr:MAG: hypothetical protein A2869_01690 [Candidatus Levybacteria bacterium RIFCSPHIGHO2_01_FULL_40_58]OGH26314.1 MAG: hypothetical protein A3C30_04360 [Candidatus Levybacteria bacterium RIFCSPHIGHO2_02_FULL_40_18]OGH31273.1 MAG: hypothetical protein A3E43_02615 [Candidatus Levybacteria bacterium RIFCSPHIGHO2_12_FULL_40_31]OGH40343.1 MAG: hypothetical protein A2894_05325 [Candidatus Levybacteria bacterium RIFCSPLOWO2_01_FULL_40_64]OGH49230.1 MAG: hypothetical protein A3I54_01115 [Candidatus Lev
MANTIWLSHTGIEALERCPRCFWLQYVKGIYQPEGIVSRLANRFDKVLKNYFNIYRNTGELPPMIQGKIEGKLQNPYQETYWIRIDNRYGFKGKLDECIVEKNGEHIPLDFKTASTDPRDRETLAAYQSQIDAYLFLLAQNNKKVGDFGYLMYVYPDQGTELHDKFPMVIHIKKLRGNPANTAKKIASAIRILEGKMPAPAPSCPFCNYRNIRIEE